MKLIAIAAAVAAAGLGAAIAGNATTERIAIAPEVHARCMVAVAVAPGYLPRAALAVENRLGQRVRVSLEGRPGSGLARTELGAIEPAATMLLPHALPAGRNLLTATAEGAAHAARRQLFHVFNRGAETCARRYLWRVE